MTKITAPNRRFSKWLNKPLHLWQRWSQIRGMIINIHFLVNNSQSKSSKQAFILQKAKELILIWCFNFAVKEHPGGLGVGGCGTCRWIHVRHHLGLIIGSVILLTIRPCYFLSFWKAFEIWNRCIENTLHKMFKAPLKIISNSHFIKFIIKTTTHKYFRHQCLGIDDA